MTRRLVCGIDSSTQSTKVELRDVDTGELVATGRGAHPAVSPPASEQDPQAWWDALGTAMHEVREHLPDVAAVAVAGQQHGLVVLDDDDRPLRPAKLWNDTTSAPQARALVDRLGAEAWADAVGLVPVASFTITKLAWMAEHEPERLARTRRIMLPHDYLTRRLSGAHVTDRGDASGTGWWSPHHGTYDPELLGLVVDDPRAWLERLPRVLGPDEAAGRVTDDAADRLGLPSGALVACGTGDNMAAALGLGLQPGDVVMSLGTSGTLYAVSDTPTADPSGLVAGFADATGRYLPLVATLNATQVTHTIAGLLDTDVAGLERLALDAGSTQRPLVLVPYLEGERTPDLPTATGLLTGLRTSTSRADLARAAYLGVLCGLFTGVTALRNTGVDLSGRRFLVGGGARSEAYQAFAADLWGGDVAVPHAQEAVAAGACVQAAAALDEQSPIETARRWSLGEGATVTPSGRVDADVVRSAYTAAADAAAMLADG
ncbi:MAG: xylulokinase [Actinobacteria bacterium]|nr:xylulokinase [Actinomycetota bacterium]